MIAQSKHEFPTTTRDFFQVLFRHRKKVFSCFSITIGVAMAIVLFYPRAYKSESKLFLRVGRESVTLDPTATTSQILPVSLSHETEVNSVQELLRSRILLEKLVDAIGPANILRSTITGKDTPQQASFAMSLLSTISLDSVSEREEAINRLAGNLNSVIEKKSDVITISGKAESPELAQRLVSKYVDIYLGEHAKMHRTAGSQAFFAEQTALLRKNMSGALDKLRRAKNEFGIGSVDNHRLILQNETIEVENRLASSKANLAAAMKKSEALRTIVHAIPERLPSEETNGFPNLAADNMRTDLYQLEIREAELASRFSDQFPSLVAVRDQIKAARSPLRLEEKRRTQSTTTINTIHNQTQLSLLNEEANVDSLKAETIALEEQATKLRERTRLLNEHEVQIVNLEQQASLCKTNYTMYSEKLEQSRIDAALQNERITNVNVIQPASLVEKPTSPNKRMVLVLGFFGAIALSIGTALFAEYAVPLPLRPREIDSRILPPVAGPVPQVAQRQALVS